MSERSELHDAIERAIKEHCAGGDLWLCAHIASEPFDARIAELEREIERLDAQWREELRIYRESGDARIAELESALLVERERICATIKATDDAASACDYMLDSDDCIRVIRGELGPANYEDAARAGNGESDDAAK